MDWISVEDRLPEIETAVLVYLTNCGMEVDCMEYDDHGDLIWCGKHKRPVWTKVTHWMELPEEPK